MPADWDLPGSRQRYFNVENYLEKNLAICHTSADHPPIYMKYGMALGDPISEGDRTTALNVHQVVFWQTLKRKLDALGVEAHPKYLGSDTMYPSEDTFFIGKLVN